MNAVLKRYSISLLARFQWLCFCAVAFCIASCSALNGPGVRIPTGTYLGEIVLTRTAPSDTTAQGYKLQSGEVAFVINADAQTYRFAPRGDSSIIVSSNGSFVTTFGKITFTDRSNRTFPDPSLVMNGECTYTFDGAILVINQTDSRTKREKNMILVRQ